MEDRRSKIDHDNPPFSRLFVVCSKNHDDEDIKAAFGKYGLLQDVWVVKDRSTHERKGIAYIKFEKASEAHNAMEELHGEVIAGDTKPLKVLLADNKGQNRSVAGETKPRSRIFILVPRTATSDQIEEEFTAYGTVEHVKILTDRATGESKGCAYVNFLKPSAAFAALESSDDKYKAVIAEPRIPRDARGQGGHEGRDAGSKTSLALDHTSRRFPDHGVAHATPHPMETISFTDPTDAGAAQRLYIVCHTSLYEEQLFSLFDLIPGLEKFELKLYRGTTESRGFAYAYYRTLEQACFAQRKLNNLEYPPGHRLIVKYAEDRPGRPGDNRPRQGSEVVIMETGDYNSGGRGDYNMMGSGQPLAADYPPPMPLRTVNIMASHQPEYKPPQVLHYKESGPNDCPFVDMQLPAPQPLAAPSTPCRGKLFIVGTPAIPDENALRDVFCRFASLIAITPIPGTSYGYIRYGMKESAEAASMVLNNTKISGNMVRLSQQEEGGGNENKRARNVDF